MLAITPTACILFYFIALLDVFFKAGSSIQMGRPLRPLDVSFPISFFQSTDV